MPSVYVPALFTTRQLAHLEDVFRPNVAEDDVLALEHLLGVATNLFEGLFRLVTDLLGVLRR